MAKYTITYACGHTAEIQLYGKYDERERKIAYYKTIDCPECQANNIANKAASKGYAELLGSDKQVRWANAIRDAKINEVNEFASKVNRNQDILERVIDDLQAETSAAWWIEHRDSTVENLIKTKL